MSVELSQVTTYVTSADSASLNAAGYRLSPLDPRGQDDGSDGNEQAVHLISLSADAQAERIPSSTRRIVEGDAVEQLRAARDGRPEHLAVLVVPPGRRRPTISAVVSAGADVVVTDADGPDTTVDFLRRRPIIRLGRRPSSVRGAVGEGDDEDQVSIHRVGTRLELRVRSADSADELYERALRRSSDAETFLDNVALRTDGDDIRLALRLRPSGRLPLRRAGRREVTVSWDGEESNFDFDPQHGINSLVLRHELARRGIRCEWTSANSLVAEHRGEELAFHVTSSPRTAQTAAMVTDDKHVARTILQSAGISVARGRNFDREDQLEEATQFFHELPSAVVKPVRGTKGRGVTVDVTSEAGFREAWTHAFASGSGGVLVEEHFRGTEVRFLVVGGECIAAALRLPPQVRGDGRSTLRQLVNAKNRERRTNPHLANRPIVFDSARLNRLQAHGLTLHSILEAGRDYIIDHKGGFSTGADSVDVTDAVHPSYLEVAARAAAAIPGLPISGVDILLHDMEQPAAPTNHIILELNSQPGIGGHHFPVYGEPRNVGGALIDLTLADRTDTFPTEFIPRELSVQIPDEDRDPDAARMAEEFEAEGFDLIWLNRAYFVARRGALQTTVWGTYTHLTGKNALVATRSPRNAEAMLTRRGVPQPRKKVFPADRGSDSFDRGAEAFAFARTLGDAALRCQTLEPHLVRGGDPDRFRGVWSRLSRRHGTILVEERPQGTALRFLIADGRVLAAVARTPHGHRDVIEELAEGYAETAAAAAAAFPGLDVCEVQMIARDPSVPSRGDDHWVGIVRAKPGLAVFERPTQGAERNLAAEIVQSHIAALTAKQNDDEVEHGRSRVGGSPAQVTVDRVHGVEYDISESDGTSDGPGYLVRIHGTTEQGLSLVGEGRSAADRITDAEARRRAWKSLTDACRGLRRTVRSLRDDVAVETQLGSVLPAEPEHIAVREAVIGAAEDLLRGARHGDEAQGPSRYPETLHRIRRRIWSPRPDPARTPGDLPVNDHDAQIDLAGSSLSYSSFLLQQEALRRGLSTVRYSRGDFVAWDRDGAELTFWRSLADTESPVSEFLCDHKQLTRQLLLSGGVPTAEGRAFDQTAVEDAVAFAESMGYPVVVKPQKGRKGRGVVTDIGDEHELREAIAALGGSDRQSVPFVVERHLKGQDYRIYVAYGEVVSVVLRRPASVIGDGRRTVAELVAAKNALRLQSTHTRTRLMKADASAERMLRRQSLNWTSVVEPGREVVLASAANISQGGDSIEVIDETHPSLLEAAVGSVRAIPGLNQAGVDFLMPDHTRDVDGQGGGVCEINALASLMASQAPFLGPTQPVAARVVELAAAERGLTVAAPTDHLRVRISCEGVPDLRSSSRWLARQARRLGLHGRMLRAASAHGGSDAAGPLEMIVAGPAPAVMRLVSGTTVGPTSRRPSVVSVLPTDEVIPAGFEEAR